MFHTGTQTLIEHWSVLRGASIGAPARAAFQPGSLPGLIPQLFMLEMELGNLPFRLAGGLLEELHAQDLKGLEFTRLWRPEDRAAVTQWAARASARAEPVVLRGRGYSAEEAPVGFEISLAPLSTPIGRDRLLGLWQPTSAVARLGGEPLVRLELAQAILAGARAAPLRLAAIDGRRIA